MVGNGWRRRVAYVVAVGGLCASSLAGCVDESDTGSGDGAVAEGGPSVVAIDSIGLEAGGRYYLGNPFSLVVDTTDGSFLVSDFFEDRVLRFARSGSLVQTYGRPGGGPGEFSDLGPTFILDDSVVVAADDRRGLFQLFLRDDGSYIGAYRYSGRIGFGGVSITENGVVFASRDLEKWTMAAVWRYPGSAIDYLVPLPEPYVRSATRQDGGTGYFAAFFSSGSVVAWADTLLTGMSGFDQLYLATIDGAVLDTLKLPSVRRRGVPDDLQRQVDDWGFGSTPFKQASVLGGLYRLSDGRTAVIHHDEALEGSSPRGRSRPTST